MDRTAVSSSLRVRWFGCCTPPRTRDGFFRHARASTRTYSATGSTLFAERPRFRRDRTIARLFPSAATLVGRSGTKHVARESLRVQTPVGTAPTAFRSERPTPGCSGVSAAPGSVAGPPARLESEPDTGPDAPHLRRRQRRQTMARSADPPVPPRKALHSFAGRGGPGVAFSEWESYRTDVAGKNIIATTDDSNVFVNRNGNLNGNTGDTDASGLNVTDATDSVILGTESADEAPYQTVAAATRRPRSHRPRDDAAATRTTTATPMLPTLAPTRRTRRDRDATVNADRRDEPRHRNDAAASDDPGRGRGGHPRPTAMTDDPAPKTLTTR